MVVSYKFGKDMKTGRLWCGVCRAICVSTACSESNEALQRLGTRFESTAKFLDKQLGIIVSFSLEKGKMLGLVGEKGTSLILSIKNGMKLFI